MIAADINSFFFSIAHASMATSISQFRRTPAASSHPRAAPRLLSVVFFSADGIAGGVENPCQFMLRKEASNC